MAEQMLRVLAHGKILVLDVEATKQRGGRRTYVGRDEHFAWKAEEIPEGVPCHMHSNDFLEPGDKPIPHCWYPARTEPDTVPASRDYLKPLKQGALLPADEATARFAGLPWTSTKKEK